MVWPFANGLLEIRLRMAPQIDPQVVIGWHLLFRCHQNSVNELTNNENLPEQELAFESHFTDPAPDILWRLVSLRKSIDGLMKHINWFGTEEAALRQLDLVRKDDGKVVAFNQYHRA